jgi:hypothetical protein
MVIMTERKTNILGWVDPSKWEIHWPSLGDEYGEDMEEKEQTQNASLNGMITDEQIAEIKRSVTNTNSMMFSYVELVRRTLDFIEQNKEKQ